MAIFKVDTPDGRVIQVTAPDDATDDEIIELAKNQEAAMKGPVAPERDLSQAQTAGLIAGGVNLVGTSVPGAVAGTYRAVRDIAQAQPITQNPSAAKQAGLATEGSKIKIGDINRVMTDPETKFVNTKIMSQQPGLAAQEIAPKLTKGSQIAGNLARRAIGPYGAITSAEDARQRFQNAQGPLDYLQAGISGVGAGGYGMSSLGNIFPPAKVPGMVVGGVADVTNMGIDQLRELMRRKAAQEAMQNTNYTAP